MSMCFLLVLAALISCAKGHKLGAAARCPTRSTQVGLKAKPRISGLQDELRIANSQMALFAEKAEQSAVNAEAWKLAAESAQKAADSANKAADFAYELASERARSRDDKVAALEAENRRQVLEIARYEIQFCTRTVVNGLLRLALPKIASSGGVMYTHLLGIYFPEKSGSTTVSTVAEQLYEDIVKCDEFGSLAPTPLSSWVASLKDQYRTFNNGQHELAELNLLWDTKGVACGGTSTEIMFKQTFAIALIQQHCITEKKPILPEEYKSIAVLSQKLDREVGRITGGKFVPGVVVPASS